MSNKKEERKIYELSAEFWAQVIRIVQQGMLSQRNVEDELRRILVEVDPNRDEVNPNNFRVLVPTAEYLEVYENNLVDDAEFLVKEAKKEINKKEKGSLK